MRLFAELLRGSYSQRRFVYALAKPPHRIQNERKLAKEKIRRLRTMDGRERSDELLVKIQELVFPEKIGQPLDRQSLADELHNLANLCQTQHQLESLPSNGADSGRSQPQLQITRTKKERRQFHYSDYRTRFVAMQVLYLGWDYQGFSSQDCGKTIENALVRALKRTKLIPETYQRSRDIQYSKSGRTDKGVSALGQVISLTVRSRRKLTEPEATVEEEYDYPTVLNSALPPEIRIWGWTPAEPDFSARYSALARQYRYFIVTDEIDVLDMALMQDCSQKFLGVHNFQNFCRMNLDQTTNHEREILSIAIEPMHSITFPRCTLYVLTITGNAFLWHQVRCIMHVLLLIARGKESPEVIDALLDTEKIEAKPLYTPADEVPLVLWEADYGEMLAPFRRSHMQLQKNRNLLRRNIHQQLTRLIILHKFYETLMSAEHDGDLSGERPQKHVTLLKRQREPSFSVRMEKHQRRNGCLNAAE